MPLLLDRGYTVLVTAPLCFTFMRAVGKETGISLIDETCLPLAKTILDHAQKNKLPLMMPIDFTATTNTFENPQNLTTTEELTSNLCGVSIGPKTVALFEKYLQKTGIIILNGPQGNPQFPESCIPFKNLLLKITENKHALKIIAGGDTLNALAQLHLDTPGCVLLSGGGATLSFLANGTLPGLEAMAAHIWPA